MRLARGREHIVRASLRTATVGSAYASTAIVVVGCIIVLRDLVSAATVAVVLAAHFAASLAAGLEPGTTKALLLADTGSSTLDVRAVAGASMIKAVATTPLLAAIWWISSPNDLPLALVLFWSLPLCLIGFLTTDLRFLLDVAGRHAAAIWLKQGSLSIGILTIVAAVGVGATIAVAIALSVMSRAIWLGAGWLYLRKDIIAERTQSLSALLRDRRGWDFLVTSILGALGASLDRVCALRYLPADAAAGYILVYEVLSKFWLLPYLLGPIIFARRVAGTQQAKEFRHAMILVAVGGLALVLGTIAATGGLRDMTTRLLGPLDPVVAPSFALAVVISSLSQLMLARVQSDGKTFWVTCVGIITLVVSLVAFPLLTLNFGSRGIGYAWLIRASIELGLLAFIQKTRTQ